jgi:hypothetical protein
VSEEKGGALMAIAHEFPGKAISSVMSVYLQKQLFGLCRALDTNAASANTSIGFRTEDAMQRMVLEMKRYVWSQKLGRLVYEVPATWFEHLKKDYAPRWVLRRWPVKWSEIKVDMFALYPNFAPPLPDQTVAGYNFLVRRADDEGGC